MATSISASSPLPAVPTTPPPATPKGSDGQQAPAATGSVPQDIVQLSSAAQAALREATETPAQTAKEASHGDIQAKHLLAKQAAAKEAAAQPSIHVIA